MMLWVSACLFYLLTRNDLANGMFTALPPTKTWVLKEVSAKWDGDKKKKFGLLYERGSKLPAYLLKSGWGFSEAFSEVVASYIDQSLRLGVVKHRAVGSLLQISSDKSVTEVSSQDCFHSKCIPSAVMRFLEGYLDIGYRESSANGVHPALNVSVAKLIGPIAENPPSLEYFARNYGGVLLLDALLLATDRALNNCFVDTNGLFFAMDNGSGFGCRGKCPKFSKKTPMSIILNSGYRRCARSVWGDEFEARAFGLALRHIACTLRNQGLELEQLSALLSKDSLVNANKEKTASATDPRSCLTKHIKDRQFMFEANMQDFLAESYARMRHGGKCSLDYQLLVQNFLDVRAQKLVEELRTTRTVNMSCPVIQFRK